jgi:uncharacterized protein YbjT (DUF2867 family)
MKTVTIFGGSGFVGTQIVQKFADSGAQVRVAVRNPLAAQYLKPLGEVGQINIVQVSLSSDADIIEVMKGSDVVINLVGILYETGSQTFEAVHVEGAKRIAKAASKLGVPKLIHMSSLGVIKKSRSLYSSSKARGEEAVLKAFPNATIIRPSIIFGPKDAFFNRFAQMAVTSPFLPLIGGGKTKMQPIYVGDVADSFIRACVKPEAQGKVYELGGPSVYTFRDLMEFLLKTINRKRLLITIPFSVAKGLARIAQYFPGVPLTPDQVELIKTDNVVSPTSLHAEDLGVYPKALEAIVPAYLERYR